MSLSNQYIEIFRAGKQTDSAGNTHDWTQGDLDKIISNLSKYPAPLVIGHPKHNDPAYGWVASLKREGDTLLMQCEKVDPQFDKLVQDGRYLNRSVRITETKDGLTLGHVGFLGAAAPAVEGLKPIQFSEGENVKNYDFTEANMPDPVVAPPPAQPAQPTVTLEAAQKMASDAAEKAANDAKKTTESEVEKLKAELAKRDEALAFQQAQQLTDKLVSTAQIKKEQAIPLAEFMACLNIAFPSSKTFEFTSGDGKKTMNPAEYFRGFLESLPKAVQLGPHKEFTGKQDETDLTVEARAAQISDYVAEKAKQGVFVSYADAAAKLKKEGK